MSTVFEETLHPRGQDANAGQFREKTTRAPHGTLEPTLEETDEYQPRGNWTILASKIDDLTQSIEKANRRLERAGIEERFSFTHTKRAVVDSHGLDRLVADVTLSRPSISMGDWQFTGAHQQTASGAFVSYWTDEDHGEDVTSARCDHCGSNRQRQKVYTVRHAKTGEEHQVGSSCVHLFTGVKPEGLWAMTWEPEHDEYDPSADEPSLASGRVREMYHGDDLMLATIRVVNDHGWVPRSRSSVTNPATIDRVTGSYTATLSDEATAEELDEIDEITDWITQPDKGSDYARNLRAVFTPLDDGTVAIVQKHAALAASAVGSYRNVKAREAERKARAEQDSAKKKAFLADPGTKLKGAGVTAKILTTRQGTDYGYGAPTHITMLTGEGHVLYWKASPGAGSRFDDNGDMVLLTEGMHVTIEGGTVKDNRVSDYNGDWETVLQRVKWTVDEHHGSGD